MTTATSVSFRRHRPSLTSSRCHRTQRLKAVSGVRKQRHRIPRQNLFFREDRLEVCREAEGRN